MKDVLLLDQKPLVDSFLNGSLRPLSSFSFTSIFAWCDFFDFEFKIMDDCLCIFTKGASGWFLYLPPLGKFTPSTVKSVFLEMSAKGTPTAANRIENIPEYLLSAFSVDSYNQYSKPKEYVYRKEDLVALRGNAYKSQRHDCNCFETRQAGHSFGPYTDADLGLCMELYDRWADGRTKSNSDNIYRSMLEENRLVHGRLLKFWRPLGLVVRVLKVKKQIIGYTFGFGLDENTFCIYAEIADLSMAGAAAYMFRNLCADEALKDFERINTMDDFAMPKVAEAKQAYHPSALVPSYCASLKKF